MTTITIPVGVTSIGFDAFAGCSSLSRIAIPKGVAEIEDDDIFSSCDSLLEVSYGGSRDEWELLLHGKTLTVEKSDCAPHTPRVTFLNLKDGK